MFVYLSAASFMVSADIDFIDVDIVVDDISDLGKQV